MARGFGPADLIPPTFQWGVRSVLPISIIGFSYGQLGDRRPIIFAGYNVAMEFDGVYDPLPYSSATFVFAADGKSFTTGGVFPYPDMYAGVSTVLGDGRLLVVGNIPVSPPNFVACTLDPISLNWTTQPPPTGPYDFNVAPGGLITLATGDALLVGSGAGFITRYNYLTDTWTTRANPLSAFSNSPKGLTLSNGEVLVSDFGAVPQIYAPISNTWHAPVTVPQATNYCESMVNLPNGLAFTTNSLSFNFVSDCYDPVARKFFPRAGIPGVHNGSIFKPPNAYYMGEGLVAIVNPSYAPRVAFYSYLKNKWYGGGFDGSVDSGFAEPLGFGAHFYLGQYGFLLIGDGGERYNVPHRSGFYTSLSTEKVNDGHLPSFTPTISVVQGKTSDRLFVTWNPASDAKTVVSDLVYYVFSGAGGPVDFGSPVTNTEIWPGTVSREIIGLGVGVTYKFGVRARNFVARGNLGNTEGNVVESAGFMTATPPAPVFSWVPAPSMSQPRKWLNGIYKADGRFLVGGGESDVGYSNGDVYSQTGLEILPSPNGPSIQGAAAIDEAPEGFNGTIRPTLIAGAYNPFGPVGETGGIRYYPYTEQWFNNGSEEYGSTIQISEVGVMDAAAIALPGTYADLLKIGGITSSGDPSTAVTTVERLFYLPRKVDYRGPVTPFTIGANVYSNSASGVILADTGLTLVLLGTASADYINQAFIIGEIVTGQTSGATGTVQSKGRYDGCLYLSGVVGTFVVGEQVLGDGVGNATVTVVEEPIGTLTIQPNPTSSEPFIAFASGNDYMWYNPPINDDVSGSAFVINFPQYLVVGLARYSFEPAHDLQNWKTVAPLNVARCNHTVTLLPSGKILVVGGSNIDGYAQSAEIYDPALDTWTLIPQAVVLPYDTLSNAFSIGEVVTGQDSGTTGTVYRVEPSFLVLTGVAGPFNHGPVEQILGSFGGDAMTTGVVAYDYIAPHVKAPLVLPGTGEVWALGGDSDVVDIFTEDITFGALVTKGTPLPSYKYGHTAHVIGEFPGWHRVVIFGGSSTKEVWSFDIDTPGSWTAETDMLEERTGHVSFLLANNKVLVVGGEDPSNQPLATAELSS